MQSFVVNLKLSPQEETALVSLQQWQLKVNKGRHIINAGDACHNLMVVDQGWAFCYRVLRDGRRQVVDFLMPGDFLAPNGFYQGLCDYSVLTATPIHIRQVSGRDWDDLLARHPNIAAKISAAHLQNAKAARDHLVGLGRRTAAERVCYLLHYLRHRMQERGLVYEAGHPLPFSRSLLADATGLTTRHLSRVLLQLQNEGIVHLAGGRIQIPELHRLAELADIGLHERSDSPQA